MQTLTNGKALECEGIISESDKSPGNDGIAKEFYEFFWEDIKNSLSDSIGKSFISGKLSTSQKQAVMKSIEKKDRDKRLIKNWSPIFIVKYRY